ncbi:Fpg/Nei family DNA glycosylase, partial [Streptomyces sp. SID10244]|nr:Fpg/Nei family DNA glycosylase [Streptomyces sp. SID10244]
RSRRPIGAMLMDQRVIAGVGNVYRAEVLFRAGIDPYRESRRIDPAEFDGLWSDLVGLMRIGVRRGRMHVVRPDDDHGAPSYATDRPRTYVYRRVGEPCRICGA